MFYTKFAQTLYCCSQGHLRNNKGSHMYNRVTVVTALVYPIILQGHWGSSYLTDDFTIILFHPVLFSAKSGGSVDLRILRWTTNPLLRSFGWD